MAKRKPARAAKKAKKTAPKKAVRKAARKAARKAVSKAGKKKAVARKAAPKKKAAPARKAAVRKAAKPARKAAKKKAAPARAVAPKKPVARRPVVAKPAATTPVERKAPALNRARRVVLDDDIVVSPPSTLDRDRTPSAAQSGGRALHDRIERRNDTSPAITGGDVDADWESANSTGDEAPGGDNMTPDQDVVDEIGAALGIEYDDNEELQGGAEIAERDEHRWDDEDS
jgi:hypothetical protein